MATHATLPTVSPGASPTLSMLLDDELAFSPSFLGRYSNHLAMALVALEQLGAGPDVLVATFDAHARGEHERRDDRPALDALIAGVARDGIAATVQARAAGLVDAPATALFHPLIRLAYALDVGHVGQVAAALLDWERRRHVLPLPPPVTGQRRLADVAAELAAHPAGTWPASFDLDGLARRPELRVALRGVALDEHTLDDVSGFAIAAHVAADEFVTLHLVTGARAVRTLSEWLDADTAARLAGHTVGAMAVGYAAVGAPRLLDDAELAALRSVRLPAAEEIAERAVADHDPHVIKLANVALVEEQRTSDPLYRFAAARVVSAVAPARELIT
ncbi:MAG TPA: hypothetical protein VNQ73_03070 [Ilumatobacter sp.]|nr:hypothetical protein [Ilumatobacter sp.]